MQVWDPQAQAVAATIPTAGHAKKRGEGTWQTYPLDGWSPDGSLLVAYADHTLAQIWVAETWNRAVKLAGHTAQLTDVAWRPDGAQVVTASEDATARIWDAKTGRTLLILSGYASPVNAVAWSPDGKRIAIGGADQKVRIWDASTGELLKTLAGHTTAVRLVSWNPNPQSDLILSLGEYDVPQDTARIWNVDTGQQVTNLMEGAASLREAEWNLTGTHLAGVAKTNTAMLWQVGDWQHSVRLGMRRAVFSLDGALIATQGENSARSVWHVLNGVEVQKFLGHEGDLYAIE